MSRKVSAPGSRFGPDSLGICCMDSAWRGRAVHGGRVKSALWWQLQASFFLFQEILLLPKLASSTLVKQTHPLVSPALSRRLFTCPLWSSLFMQRRLSSHFLWNVQHPL